MCKVVTMTGCRVQPRQTPMQTARWHTQSVRAQSVQLSNRCCVSRAPGTSYNAHRSQQHSCGSIGCRDARFRTRQSDTRCQALPGVNAALFPLPATSSWGIWAFLVAAAAAGLWSERTRWGKELSGALVATLVGLTLSNAGVLPSACVEYNIVNKYLLPLAVPLLLFAADLRKVFRSTGRLLLIFAIGSVGTVVGTWIAFRAFPLASLGADSWKVAAALCARHIGGAVNYVAVAETLSLSGSASAAGLAADNLICAIYFSTLYALARNIPPDPDDSVAAAEASGLPQIVDQGGTAAVEVATAQHSKLEGFTVLHACTGIAIAAMLCYLGSGLAAMFGVPGAAIPVITAITVLLATLAPSVLQPYVRSSEDIAGILMHIFFATVGASGSVAQVVRTAPALFVFCFVQIAVHLAIIFAAGKLLRFNRRDVLLASNANVGGPTTAAGMVVAKKWRLSMVPAILVGTFGYAIATFLAVAMGSYVLKPMAV